MHRPCTQRAHTHSPGSRKTHARALSCSQAPPRARALGPFPLPCLARVLVRTVMRFGCTHARHTPHRSRHLFFLTLFCYFSFLLVSAKQLLTSGTQTSRTSLGHPSWPFFTPEPSSAAHPRPTRPQVAPSSAPTPSIRRIFPLPPPRIDEPAGSRGKRGETSP